MQPELLITASAFVLAGVFAPALKHKVVAWPRFLASLQAYRLLPSGLTKPAGVLLVGLEAIAVLGLLSGPFLVGIQGSIVAGAFLLAAFLLVIYALAMAINLGRGRQFIDCGCGDEPASLGLGVLTRNVVLIGLAVVGYGMVGDSPGLGIADIMFGIGFAAIGICLYQAAEQLLANRTSHQRLWLGM